MKYAIIKTGGKQYKVKVGDTLNVELLGDAKTFIFEEVLLVVNEDKVEVGMPIVAGVKVFADVLTEVKAEKIEVFKYKSKSRYRKHTGHRQHLSQVKITGIGDKVEVKSEPKTALVGARRGSPAKDAKAKKVAAKKPAVKKPVAKKSAK